MDKYRSNVSSIFQSISFIGLVVISLTVFLFLTKSAGMQSLSGSTDSVSPDVSSEQNLVLGKLVFSTVSGSFAGPQLYIRSANADGSGITGLAGSLPPATTPTFSPDGTKIAFVGYNVGADIYVMNADGSNQTNISHSINITELNPSWSVTGKIVYERDSQIWTMNADGSNQQQFTGITQPAPTTPQWSADGTKIAFASGGEIWKINSDGTNEQRVTTNATTDSEPFWSPDGAKIVFGKGGTGIAVIDANGANETNLTTVAGDSKPAWSSDGTTIAFRRDAAPGGIYVMDASGGNQIRIIADSSGTLGSTHSDPAWQPTSAPRRTAFDFDGDGHSDVSVFRGTDRIWYLLRSQAGIAGYQWGLATDTLAPADYDGDLKTDVAVWRASDGNFYILNSFDNTARIENFGLAGDVPTGGDFDGDGRADLAIYRVGTQSVFYYRASMSNPNGNVTVIPWGISGDKPVAGDYDGDGRTDAAVYRPSNGVWYARKSSDGQLSANAFGLAGDTLVPADYDADGKTDLAVYRGGVWYVSQSSQGVTIFQYGLSTDTPAPADYDGDGRADAAIYRNGAWWILKSQSGTTEITNFGIGGDIPIPSSYVR